MLKRQLFVTPRGDSYHVPKRTDEDTIVSACTSKTGRVLNLTGYAFWNRVRSSAMCGLCRPKVEVVMGK